jgi:hypothetical protein
MLTGEMSQSGLVGKLTGVMQRPNCTSTSGFSWTRIDEVPDQEGLGGRSILTGLDELLRHVDFGK